MPPQRNVDKIRKFFLQNIKNLRKEFEKCEEEMKWAIEVSADEYGNCVVTTLLIHRHLLSLVAFFIVFVRLSCFFFTKSNFRLNLLEMTKLLSKMESSCGQNEAEIAG